MLLFPVRHDAVHFDVIHLMSSLYMIYLYDLSFLFAILAFVVH